MKKHLKIFLLTLLLASACGHPPEIDNVTQTKKTIDIPTDPTSFILADSLITKAYKDSNGLFKKYKESEFYTTTFSDDGKIPYKDICYEYILHSDTIIVINKHLIKDFMFVFTHNNKAFSEIFIELMHRNKNDLDKYDYVLKNAKYKTYGNINDCQKVYGDKEEIWQITTNDHILGENSCYLNIIFNYKKDSKVNNLNNLIYLKSISQDCDI